MPRIDSAHFLEYLKIKPQLLRNPAEGGHIFREAGTAIAEPGPQELRADAGIKVRTSGDILNISIDRFGKVCHRIDEGNLHRQEGV